MDMDKLHSLVKVWSNAELKFAIKMRQGAQKRHSPHSELWKDISRELAPMLEEMARRQKAGDMSGPPRRCRK